MSTAGHAPDAPRFTLVFNGNIGNVQGNIFKLDTPFGRARAAAVGDALSVKDDLLEAIELLQGFDFRLDDSEHGKEIRRRVLAAITKAKIWP